MQPSPGNLMTFVHIEIHDWRPSTWRRLKANWPAVLARLPKVFFCQGKVDDAKFQKFISYFGFSFLADCICTDGVNRRIYINRH